jgi:hypothetical protein
MLKLRKRDMKKSTQLGWYKNIFKYKKIEKV